MKDHEKKGKMGLLKKGGLREAFVKGNKQNPILETYLQNSLGLFP